MGIKYKDIRNYRFRICGFSKRPKPSLSREYAVIDIGSKKDMDKR